MKSFRRRTGAGPTPAPGARSASRRAALERTHASTSDPAPGCSARATTRQPALLYGPRAMENRNGLAVAGVLTRARHAEASRPALAKVAHGPKTLVPTRIRQPDLVMELREWGHAARRQNDYATERPAPFGIDGCTTRHTAMPLAPEAQRSGDLAGLKSVAAAAKPGSAGSSGRLAVTMARPPTIDSIPKLCAAA